MKYMVSINELVDYAEELLSQGSFTYSGAPEALTRQYLLHPLLSIFDWSDSPRDEFHYISEFKGSMKRKWEDIVLMKTDLPLVFIECKSLLNDDILTTININELLDYMKEYNRTNKDGYRVDWGILTNFKESHIFYVSDSSPFISLSYTDYAEDGSLLKDLLTVEGIKRDGLAHYYSENKREKLGDSFLQDLKKWRLIIANGCFDFDSTLTIEQIKNISQQFLDRLIFIRMLETFGILPYNWLRSIFIKWKEGIIGLNNTYSEVIRQQFITIESLYDTELFAHTLIDEIEIDDSYLKELMKVEQLLNPTIARKIGISGTVSFNDKGLYGYSFKTLSIDLIGSAYERYLAHDISIIDDSIQIMETTAVRKKEGIYYTPNYIVKYIVKNTVEKSINEIVNESIRLIDEENYEEAKNKIIEIKSIKVLDPACGSGSFLIEVFDCIYSAYHRYNDHIIQSTRETQSRSSMDQYVSNTYDNFLIPSIGESILLDNLHGVDLDPQAVEITKLNLWIKMLSRSPEKYRPIFEIRQTKLLPSLDLKIKCGNSLVHGFNDEFRSEQRVVDSLEELSELRSSILSLIIKTTPSFDTNVDLPLIFEELSELMSRLRLVKSDLLPPINQRIVDEGYFELDDDVFEGLSGNPFNWEVEFPEVFEHGGFTTIVGNPPHGADLTSEERRYITNDYELGQGKKNTAYIFIELCVEILQDNGKIGLVIPKSLLFSQEWGKVRNYLLENVRIEEIIDISKAFKEVLLEQVIVIVENSLGNDNIRGLEMNTKGEITNSNLIPANVYELMNSFPILCNTQDIEIFNIITDNSRLLGTISETCRGFPLQRQLLDVCIGENCEETLKGKDIKRFNTSDSQWFLLREQIEGREKYRKLKRNKIIAQRIVAHIENPIDHIAIMAAYDSCGYVNVDTVENIIITEEDISPHYILGLLNSRLIGWFTYKFIFCNAIRTMDFDEYYVNKIPFKNILETNKESINDISETVSQYIEICQQKNWLFASFASLLQVYNLIRPESIQYFLEPNNATRYHFDLISIRCITPDITGTVTEYCVYMNQNRISLNASIKESSTPIEAISFIITNDDVRNFLYIALKLNSGKKHYRTPYSVLEKVFDEFTIPLLISRTAEDNIGAFSQLLTYIDSAFTQKVSEDWTHSPIRLFNPHEIINSVEQVDDILNNNIFELFLLTENNKNYIMSQSPKLTRLT